MDALTTFEALTDPDQIAAAQQQLQAQFEAAATRIELRKIASSNSNWETEVHWIDTHEIWYACGDPGTGWSNALGITNSRARTVIKPMLWLSPTKGGLRYARFVRNTSGEIYLAHSGQLGGGKKGVDKQGLLDHVSGQFAQIDVNRRQWVLLGRLGDDQLIANVARYLREVADYKAAVPGTSDDGEPGDSDGSEPDDQPWSLVALLTQYDEPARAVLIEWLAHVVQHAHEQSPNCWNMTRRGSRLRINIGRNVSLEVHSHGVIGLGIHLPSAGSAADISTVEAFPDFTFVDVAEGVLRRMTIADFLAHRDLLRPALDRFIEESAKAFRNTPFARYHAADLVAELEQLFGSPLPRPRHERQQPAQQGLHPAPERVDVESISETLQAERLYYPADTVASYLLALQAKRFVILSGISGTGKTQLALAVAKTFQSADAERCYELVAVRPDWTDNRGLLGYENPITREYQGTPFLRLLLRARQEYQAATQAGRAPALYFVILDEMNLARVEHYFSDFLSALESGEPLELHDELAIERAATGQAIPRRLVVPPNLHFTGTVNVDETTYMFSPKVLDRAFVLEFNEVDLASFGAPPIAVPGTLTLDNFLGLGDLAGSDDAWPTFRKLLDGDLHRALLVLNHRLELDHRHFGYRVAKEIARFVVLAAEQAGNEQATLWHAFDIAVLSKALPKMHGTQQEIGDLLARLLAFAIDVNAPIELRANEGDWTHANGQLRSDHHPTPKLPRAAAKLWRMMRRLRLQGHVSFIE